MRSCLLAGLVFLLTLCGGCGKKTTPAAQPPSSEQAQGVGGQLAPGQAPQPEPPPPPSVTARAENAPRQGVVGEVDPILTAELRNFIQLRQRMPVSFGEFARVRLDSIPRPPAGKKWAIDTTTLEVKAVSE